MNRGGLKYTFLERVVAGGSAVPSIVVVLHFSDFSFLRNSKEPRCLLVGEVKAVSTGGSFAVQSVNQLTSVLTKGGGISLYQIAILSQLVLSVEKSMRPAPSERSLELVYVSLCASARVRTLKK